MRMTRLALSLALAVVLASVTSARAATVPQNIWDTQAIDSAGLGNNPYVDTTDKIVIEGVALNDSDDYLDPNFMFQVYVQGIGADRGGIAVFSASFFQDGPFSAKWNAEYARLSSGWEAGDRVRVEGFIANHNGKTNINERHSGDPAMDFDITLVQPDYGMPTPIDITDLAAAKVFDQTRQSGGELYQGQWARLRNVTYYDGTWAPDETIRVADTNGATFDVLLSGQGSFDSADMPTGSFDVVGLFDQEDASAPYTAGYRLWVKNASDFSPASSGPVIPEPLTLATVALGAAFVAVRRRRTTR